MVVKLITRKVDDLDQQSPAEVSIEFTYKRRHYVIDLSAANAAQMDADFQRWITFSRPVRAPGHKSSKMMRRTDPAKVRTWAREHGFVISDKGRIPQEIETAYKNRESATRQGNVV
ncbi:Lsr2 family protein [Rhodococcus sp. BS-15]|uniref:histone-like nucleoid-structuring protein Lsr2 n=1 Tax=Rhodococcus sp. BS-15 TaxID=1304954 RepID=UPI001650E49E|nr:Lsr2 family protein [Rhodococcus sp. BS-15]